MGALCVTSFDVAIALASQQHGMEHQKRKSGIATYRDLPTLCPCLQEDSGSTLRLEGYARQEHQRVQIVVIIIDTWASSKVGGRTGCEEGLILVAASEIEGFLASQYSKRHG